MNEPMTLEEYLAEMRKPECERDLYLPEESDDASE